MSEIEDLRAENERLTAGLMAVRALMEEAIAGLDTAADVEAKMVTALVAVRPLVASNPVASQLVRDALSAAGLA
jgi:hypothetical protein